MSRLLVIVRSLLVCHCLQSVLSEGNKMSGSGERWKPVPSFEGLYSVSDWGNVRRDGGNELNAWTSSTGYPIVRLSDGLRRPMVHVHRLVMAAFVGPCPVNKEVNHKDGIKSNPRLENLEYVTRSENLKHAIRLGLNKVPSRKGIPWKSPEGWVRAEAEFTCEHCGVLFYDVPSRIGLRKHCTRQCQLDSLPKKVEIKCAYCGKTRICPAWRVSQFCSLPCSNKGRHAARAVIR